MVGIYYFGSLYQRGHHLVRVDEVAVHETQLEKIKFPWTFDDIDGGFLKTGNITDIVDGRVHWFASADTKWYGFVWWDRSCDTRPGSNSGFYVPNVDAVPSMVAFRRACDAFPQVVRRQRIPFLLRDKPLVLKTTGKH